MDDSSNSPKPDIESFDPTSTLDDVLISLFRNTDAPDTAFGRVFRLVLQKLWCSNKLTHPENDITARLAALDLATGGIQFGTDTTKYDFTEYMKIWETRTRDCAVRINQICHENPMVLSHVCRHIEKRIATSQPSFSAEPKKSLTELVIYLYSGEADKLAAQNEIARLAYDAKEEFQIEVVTLLKFCGGEPATIRTFNIPNTLDWSFFQQYLSTATANWQSEMLGYPNGYSLANGEWWYQIVKDGELQPSYHQLLGEAQYENLMTDMLYMSDKKGEVPRFIHVMVPRTLKDKQRRLRDDPDFGFGGVYDLNDESGYSYIPLPPGFIPALHSSAENAAKMASKVEKIRAATAKTEADAAAERADKKLDKKMQRRKDKRRNRKDKLIRLKYKTDETKVTEDDEQNDEDEGSDEDLFGPPAPNTATKAVNAPSRKHVLKSFPKPLPRRSSQWRPTASTSPSNVAALELAFRPKFNYDEYRSVEDGVRDEEGSDEE